ncbi:peptide/nickel transport system permease protein [Amycolatopsis bartoniae]|uniref:ABC transporter permease n=1 Tax=Amycolatopsis bartoniae TaxID=941986 RepID=A0A8H9ISK3_9PSEU|nr:ABC transporter permease [Amycolatopsis bartoniae]MBB2939718.1 peptide/nickel transport system permease protein [Amycolatopsis bartoniae]GHF36284.1 ABC transporter permease [Amycolatopsis bartoniae]
MIRFIAWRLAGMVPIILLVTLVSFLLLELVPGDPARVIAGDFATPDQIEATRVALGLDRNVVVRYFAYLGDIVTGSFGNSVVLQPGRGAMELILQALPVTLSLTVVALVIAVVIAVPLGVAAALRRGTWVDHVLTGLTSLSLALPPFVIGPLLVTILAVAYKLFPAVGYQPLSQGFTVWLSYLFLPALAIAVNPIAEIARQIRGSLIDVLDQSYIRTANAKGLSTTRVIGKHAIKNAAIPAVTVLGLQVTRVIGGTVVVEIVFAMPGIGALAVNSVLASDFPVVQALVLFSALAVLATNLLVDLTYGYFDPRLRKG